MKNTNLIIGEVNTYKTTGVVFKEVINSIKNGENLLILDNKNEYFGTFKSELDKNNYNTLVFNLDDAYKSNSFNPLMLPYKYYKEGNKDKAVEMIKELGLEIFKTDNPYSDPFWENSAADYFMALVLILFKEGKEEEINLGSIQVMVSKSDNITKYFDSLDVLDSIYIAGSTTVYAPSDTRGSILSVMKQRLNEFCVREMLLNNLLGNDIDLSNIKDKTAIFIIGNEKINRLGNILIDELVNVSIDNNIKFTFFLDGLCDVPAILEFNRILDKKMRLFATVRSLEELEDKYGKYIMGKFENCVKSIDVVDKDNLINIGNSKDYPESKVNKGVYFNIEELVNKF